MSFTTYSTDRVAGDTPVRVADLKPGDVLRSYSGLADTLTVVSVESRGLAQYGRRMYDVTYDDGTRSPYAMADDLRDLATGGPRI